MQTYGFERIKFSHIFGHARTKKNQILHFKRHVKMIYLSEEIRNKFIGTKIFYIVSNLTRKWQKWQKSTKLGFFRVTKTLQFRFIITKMVNILKVG